MLVAMSAAFDDTEFTQALTELRFEFAQKIIQRSPNDHRSALEDRLRGARESAQEAAGQLMSRVSALARQHDYRRLLDIRADPATAGLLEMLTASAQQRATVHLEAATRWAERQAEANRRRLTEARAALGDLDLRLARSLVNRLDEHFLGNPEREERDGLLLEIEARWMEVEELTGTASRVMAEERPPRRRWWRKNDDR